MAFPQAVPFPPPQAFPLSPLFTDPTAGVNPYGGDNFYGLQQAFASNTAILQNRALQQQSLAHAAQLAATNAALGPAALTSDPHTWTPEEAAHQTDVALAKLSTVNPELAQKLSDSRTGQDSGTGFFGALKNAVGEVLGGGLSAFGKVLDVVGRTMNIVPNLAFDVVDGGAFDPAHDLAGALGGTVRHNWNSVFQEMGWKGDGPLGVVRAVLGLAADVATDPITYLIPVGSGAKLSEAAVLGAKEAGTKGVARAALAITAEDIAAKPELAAIAKYVAGRSEEELVADLSTKWKLLMGEYEAHGARVGTASNEMAEAAWAMVSKPWEEGELSLMRHMFEVGDRTGRLITARGLRTAVRDGLVLSDGLQVGARDVKTLFEEAIRAGAGHGAESQEWRLAKTFSAVSGGLRFKYQIPFTDFRYISSPVFSRFRFMPHAVGQTAMRFFAGQSGMANMVHLIASGAVPEEEGWAAMRAWMEGSVVNGKLVGGGWQRLKDEFPEVSDMLGGRGHNLGSMLYSASDKVGGITALWDKGARAARAGIAMQAGYRTVVEAENAGRQLINEAVRRAIGTDRNINVDFERLFPEGDVALQRTASKYASYFPAELGPGVAAAGAGDAAIDTWFRRIHPDFVSLDAEAVAMSGGEGLVAGESDRLARYYRVLQDMKDTAKYLTAEQKDHLDLRAQWRDAVKSETGKWEGAIGNVKSNLGDAPGLNPSNVDDWRAGVGRNHPIVTAPEQEGKVYYLTPKDASARNSARNIGIGDEHILNSAEGKSLGYEGYVVSTVETEGAIPVVIRGKSFIELDAELNAKAMGGLKGGTAERDLLAVREEAFAGVDQVYTEAAGALKDEVLDPMERTRKVNTMMVDQIRGDHPGAAGVFQRGEDGNLTAVIFDRENIKPVGEHFNHVEESEGYLHRSLAPKAREWVNGVVAKDEAQILLREPQLRAEISRRTSGMTFEEAEGQARAIIKEKYPEADFSTLPGDIFETHVGKVDLEYIDAAANDIKAQILGRAADRQVRLGKVAPFMFSHPPQAQEFEWALNKGMLRAIKVAGAKVTKDVLLNKKAEAAWLNFLHTVGSRQAEGFGDFALLVDEGTHIGLPDRELQMIRLHEGSRQRAFQFIADQEARIAAGHEAVGAEEGLYQQARDEFLANFKLPAEREEAEAIQTALKRAKAVAEKNYTGAVLPDAYKEARTKLASAEAAGAPEAELVELRADVKALEDIHYSHPLLKPDNPAAESLGNGVYRIRQPQASGKFKDFYFKVDEDGNLVGYRIAKETGEVDTQIYPPFREKGHGTALIQAHWQEAGVYEGSTAERLAKAEALIAHQSFSEDGRDLNIRELERIAQNGRESGPVTEAIFDTEVAAGNLHYNKNTRSLFTREGNLVKRGGGSELRPQYARDLEREDLRAQSAELAKAKQALDEGTVYRAPPEAQAGQRLPGERRTPQERALYESQTSQARLELAGTSHRKATRQAVAAGQTLGRLRTNLNRVMNELNRTYAEARGIHAELQPAFMKIEQGNMLGLTALRVPGLEGYAMPAYMAAEWHAALDKFGTGGLSGEWRKFVLGPWKRWATYRNPGFHVRNFYGAWFNNFLGGVTTHEYEFSWRVNNFGNKDWSLIPVSEKHWADYALAEQFGKDTRGILTYGDIQEHMAQTGTAARANTQTVLGAADQIDAFKDAVSTLKRDTSGRGRAALHAVDEKLKDIGSTVEDFHRVAAWAAGMGATGGDTYGARAFTMLRHGDYSELTTAEDHIRDLIPFYKWMRTNTPYQIRMLGENPAYTLLVADKVKTAAYDIAGVDRRQAEVNQPDWMRDTLTVPIPSWFPVIGSKAGPDGLKYAMFDLPYNDLYRGFNDYISSVLPVARNFVESYGFHKQSFTGKDLTGAKVPLSGVFNLPGIRDIIAASPWGTKGADGGIYIDDRLENVLTAVPIYSRLRNFVEADPARVQQRLGGFISLLSGVSVRQEDATAAELDFYYNEVEPLLAQYRDMGVTFPTAQDFVGAAEAVNPTLPSYQLPQQISSGTAA